MKTNFKVLLSSMMMILAIGFTACEGDQGEIGPKGDRGLQGDKGAKGDQGDKGEVGDNGFVESTSFGNIELTVSGIDFEGAAYTEVLDFKYVPEDHSYASTWSESSGSTAKNFGLYRVYKPAARTVGRSEDISNSMYFSFNEFEGILSLNEFEFSASFITGGAVNSVRDYISMTPAFVISDYSFNEETGELSVRFDYTFKDSRNNDVEVSGVVNVIVYHVNAG